MKTKAQPHTALFALMAFFFVALIGNQAVAQEAAGSDQLASPELIVGSWATQPTFSLQSVDGYIVAEMDDTEYDGEMIMVFTAVRTGTVSAGEQSLPFTWSMPESSRLYIEFDSYNSTSLLVVINPELLIMIEEQGSSAYGAILRRIE